MHSRLALVLAALSAAVNGLAAAQTADAPDRVVALQRLVFAPESAPQPARVDAQLDLANVYAIGDGVEQDPEFACGLAAVAQGLSDQFDDDALLAHARRTRDDLCREVRDPETALQLAACPRFGVAPQTLSLDSGATLVINRRGFRIESDSGTRESEWATGCGDIFASIRVVGVDPPGGTSWPRRQFLELLVWHQLQGDDGKPGDRTLEWRVVDLDRNEIQADRPVIVVKDSQASIWPMPPTPEEVRDGATLRMLPSGRVRWSFERAADLGTGMMPAPEQPMP